MLLGQHILPIYMQLILSHYGSCSTSRKLSIIQRGTFWFTWVLHLIIVQMTSCTWRSKIFSFCYKIVLIVVIVCFRCTTVMSVYSMNIHICWKPPGHYMYLCTPEPGRLGCVISIQKGVKSDAYPVAVSQKVTKNLPVSFYNPKPGFKSPSLGGGLPLFDPISLLSIHLPPKSEKLPLFGSHLYLSLSH